MKFVKKIVNYFQEVRLEVNKVSWPSRAQTIRMTIVVLLASAFISAFVGGLDALFTNLLNLTLSR